MTKYLKTREGSLEDLAKQMQNKVLESDYQDKFKKELDKAGKPIGQMTGAEKKSFFNKIDKMHTAKNEQAKNPYAIGMAAAMKAKDDKPPLKKSTITKAHDIAKSIEKDQKEDYTNKDVDKFHTQLDKLVHKSFGHSSDEKKDKKEEVKEARWEIEGRVNYKGVGPEDGFHMVIDAPNQDAAEDKAYDELEKARKQRKIGPGGGGGIDEMEIEYIEKTTDRLQSVTQQPLGNSYDPSKKEVKETHSFVTNKQNEKQKEAGSEKSPISHMVNKSVKELNQNTGKTFAEMAAELKEKKEEKKELQAGEDTRDPKQKTMTGQVATSPEMNPRVDYKY